MIEEIRLPEISENVESADVIEILVKVGDFVEADQPIVELETEKATFEIPSPVRGKIVEINVQQGEIIKVGQVIAKVDSEAQTEKEKPASAVEEISEEKKTVNVESAAEKMLTKKKTEEVKKPEFIDKPEDVQIGKKAIEQSAGAASAAPSVRQLARELGIDISSVRGTGPGGRISSDDVKMRAKSIIAGAFKSTKTSQSKVLPDFSKWGNIDREAMKVTHKKIVETLSYGWSNVPQVTQYDQADITEIEELRREYSSKVQEAGGKLTITSILLKVLASALKEFPKFNASLDIDRGEIIFKKYYNISVAVDTDRGLLVPVIKDVDKQNVLQLSVKLTELAERTRNRQIDPGDMVGGNFTISNLGGIGGTNFAPIVYWPQVAILGVARATQQPIYINDQLQRRRILPLSLSYDHRIIDGTQGARFLRWIIDALEKPFLLVSQKQPHQ